MISASPRGRAEIATAWTLLAAMGAGVVLLGAAMAVYPGGTAMDRGALEHSFWRNFLCDLTEAVAVNGSPNPLGARLARGALAAFGVALACFWWLLPSALDRRGGRALTLSIRGLGTVSVLALVAVPLVSGPAHMVAVFASSIPGLGAAILATVACARARVWPLLLPAAATVAAGAIDSVLYARSYLLHPRIVVPALPAFQRLALLAMLAWMGVAAARVLLSRNMPSARL